mmetsp:Transcript_31563/g.39266  ORF Transcript_31563/g.39266 Transcript_31563/m.39266 type:complete len:97 (+) Transcript_31563:653-943(+)
MPPTAVTFFSLYVKYVRNHARLYPFDFTIAYWGLMSTTLQISAVVYFMTADEAEFSLADWAKGFAASFFNAIGSTFSVACLSTGAPMGPSNALINS